MLSASSANLQTLDYGYRLGVTVEVSVLLLYMQLFGSRMETIILNEWKLPHL